MSANEIKRIDARALKAQLHDGGELALLDAREELPFGRRHLLMASCVPLSRLELLVDDLVPRRGARVVWCDDGEGLAARAAARMSALGYQDVGWLDGGVAAWEAAGFRIYSGVHVPSKAFAEVVEHEAGTPWISAQDLQALIDRKADIAIYDSRSYEEYHNNSIPTAISVPGAELVYRFADLTPSPDTTVIVNCGGRTRSIIGAQSLINAGVRNKVVSLKDGTMAWHLADLEVVHGATRRPPEVSAHGLQSALEAAARVAARCGIARIDRRTLESWRAEATRRTLYVLDVRSPEEYEAGHLRGARSAPGGQLVQETDSHVATWGARVVLVDDNGVRATMTASWLKQMGWPDVAVLVAGPADGDWVTGRHVPRVLGLEATSAPAIDAMDLRDRLAAGEVVVIDLDLSRRYALGPYSRRLVCDPVAPWRHPGESPGRSGDRADLGGRRAGGAGGGRASGGRVGAGDDPHGGHAGLDPGGIAARDRDHPHGRPGRRRLPLAARARSEPGRRDARVPDLGDQPGQRYGQGRRSPLPRGRRLRRDPTMWVDDACAVAPGVRVARAHRVPAAGHQRREACSRTGSCTTAEILLTPASPLHPVSRAHIDWHQCEVRMNTSIVLVDR